jgi:hypothetical protein
VDLAWRGRVLAELRAPIPPQFPERRFGTSFRVADDPPSSQGKRYGVRQNLGQI